MNLTMYLDTLFAHVKCECESHTSAPATASTDVTSRKGMCSPCSKNSEKQQSGEIVLRVR